MATWSLQARLVTGDTLDIGTDNHIWWNGSDFGVNISVGKYQDSTHVADSSDDQQDSASPVHNTKYLDSTHSSIDDSSSSSLPIPWNLCGLVFTFSDVSSVATSAAKIYVYDGVEDLNPVSNINFQIAEGDVSTSWRNANGFQNALDLADQSSAMTHDFCVATSLSPQTAGLKAGKLKIVLNYV